MAVMSHNAVSSQVSDDRKAGTFAAPAKGSLVRRAVIDGYRAASGVMPQKPDFLGVLSARTCELVDSEIPEPAVLPERKLPGAQSSRSYRLDDPRPSAAAGVCSSLNELLNVIAELVEIDTDWCKSSHLNVFTKISELCWLKS